MLWSALLTKFHRAGLTLSCSEKQLHHILQSSAGYSHTELPLASRQLCTAGSVCLSFVKLAPQGLQMPRGRPSGFAEDNYLHGKPKPAKCLFSAFRQQNANGGGQGREAELLFSLLFSP